ncbi:hypothetical protein Tco_1232488 [Tanacetum coccineum]
MFKPRTLNDTYCLANLQEATNESRAKSKPVYSGYKNVTSTSSRSYGGSSMPTTNNRPLLALPAPKHTVKSGRKQLSKQEYEEKRAKNQCFYCDQKYVPGHKCSGQMFVLEVLVEDEEEHVEEGCFEECLAEDFNPGSNGNAELQTDIKGLLEDLRMYPPTQKDIIETMVRELLDSGVIRQSNSPFSSPIVMVKKKDGS